MISMSGYFFYRDDDWNTLTGGLIPKIQKDQQSNHKYDFYNFNTFLTNILFI